LKRLLILNPTELTRDPRARRTAAAAFECGWEIVGVCQPAPGEQPLELPGVDVVRVGREGIGGALRRAGLGGMRRVSVVERELRGVYRLGRLARTTASFAAAGRGAGRFDTVLSNDLGTLPAGYLLAQLSGARLVYDAHELYGDSEPDYPRSYGRAAGALERALARRADAVVTVSEPIAAELRRRLGLREQPVVVLNCPERIEVEPRHYDTGPLRVIYQGAMGVSRPLEDLFVAAEVANRVEVTIRVANANLTALRSEVLRRNLEGRVFVAEPVEPTALIQALSGFEVGLVINRPLTRNDELVYPNKLFEYLMAGLAVVVPHVEGLAPLVNGEGIGLTYEPGRPDALGAALTKLALDRARLGEMRARARTLALERFNAEAQRETLASALAL
jgi:glycosyltransferase involved in cell wall biosynthesis